MTSVPASFPADLPLTAGALRSAGYLPKSVKDEIAANLLDKLRSGVDAWPGIVGFDRTVIPQLERALLAGHDVVLLGERGQAKSRIMRDLTKLLDAEVPTIAGCEINDEPFAPICTACRHLVAEKGDETPVV